MRWTPEQIQSTLEGLDIPVAYYQFRQNDDPNPGPNPPYVCWVMSGSDDLQADNNNYQRVRDIDIELYSDNKDFALEKQIENLLDANNLTYDVIYTYIETEKLYETIYRTSVLM